MGCEHFEEGRGVRCRAVEGLLVPTHHERERYCAGDGAERCPTRQLYRLRRRPLSQAEYFAQWIPMLEPRRAAACVDGHVQG
jgi:hypothetical protein